jgi:hypothetical protein
MHAVFLLAACWVQLWYGSAHSGVYNVYDPLILGTIVVHVVSMYGFEPGFAYSPQSHSHRSWTGQTTIGSDLTVRPKIGSRDLHLFVYLFHRVPSSE